MPSTDTVSPDSVTLGGWNWVGHHDRPHEYVILSSKAPPIPPATDSRSLVVSIPIVLLHKTHMKLPQKVSLGCFLCLSLVMVCIALVRVSDFRIRGAEDITWDLYWVYMEAGVACIMSSVAVMRAALGIPGSRSRKPIKSEWYSMRERMRRRNARKGSSQRFW